MCDWRCDGRECGSTKGEYTSRKKEENARGKLRNIKKIEGIGRILKIQRQKKINKKNVEGKNEIFKDQMVQNIELNSYEEKSKNTHTRNAILWPMQQWTSRLVFDRIVRYAYRTRMFVSSKLWSKLWIVELWSGRWISDRREDRGISGQREFAMACGFTVRMHCPTCMPCVTPRICTGRYKGRTL